MRMGRWSRNVNYGAGSAANAEPAADPRWLAQPSDLSKVTEGLRRVGFTDEECRKITVGNWLRVYGEVFG
jgi:microsomal dipeptidase-like Zn-dependent dipeptidase